MSDKPKFPRAQALAVARELCIALKPVTDRLVVAGSLGRGKMEVGDVEILFVPKVELVKVGLFDSDSQCVDQAYAFIERLLAGGNLSKRPNINGGFTWGQRNKLAIHHPSGVPVDLFSTTQENWWVSLVVRTGSKETNLLLTTGAIKLGRTLNAYGCGVTERDGNVIPATSEQHVFELCGVPYREPNKR
jgi:DNA polymerase/3'-5' exonuclease PolX